MNKKVARVIALAMAIMFIALTAGCGAAIEHEEMTSATTTTMATTTTITTIGVTEAKTESEQITSYDYSKILNGDLSDFSGNWKNGENENKTLNPDGTTDYQMAIDGVVYGEEAFGFEKLEDGSYLWQVTMNVPDGMSGYAILLFPVGVDVIAYGEIAQTDKSKVRLYTGHDFYPANEMGNRVFYLD